MHTHPLSKLARHCPSISTPDVVCVLSSRCRHIYTDFHIILVYTLTLCPRLRYIVYHFHGFSYTHSHELPDVSVHSREIPTTHAQICRDDMVCQHCTRGICLIRREYGWHICMQINSDISPAKLDWRTEWMRTLVM